MPFEGFFVSIVVELTLWAQKSHHGLRCCTERAHTCLIPSHLGFRPTFNFFFRPQGDEFLKILRIRHTYTPVSCVQSSAQAALLSIFMNISVLSVQNVAIKPSVLVQIVIPDARESELFVASLTVTNIG